MRKYLLIFFIGLSLSDLFAHEVDENRAKISIHHQSVYLTLTLHANKWTESFPIHKLDDIILKDTSVYINTNPLPLRLKKIEKKSNHYSIQYLATTQIDSKIKSASLILPKELGKVVVTIIRANTKITYPGEEVKFSF